MIINLIVNALNYIKKMNKASFSKFYFSLDFSFYLLLLSVYILNLKQLKYKNFIRNAFN
jgi:hypothetical protein